MKCPVCSTDLMMADRQGIEIDYCPQCRGVWLDRGELDKLIERSNKIAEAYDLDDDDDDRRYERRRDDDRRYERDDDDYRKARYPEKKKRRESFLGDMFDIFG